MKIVYMGTPRFAVPALRALHAAGHEIAGVVTRIDKPAGRGKVLTPPAVKIAALELGLSVLQPKRVREPAFVETLRSLAPEAIVVAAYGQILPKDILALPRYGCINIHASLLPAYRGAAPINWAIINGEAETGITVMQMDEGMDTGAILSQDRLTIAREDTAGSLTEKMAILGAAMIVDALPRIQAGALPPHGQDHSRATLAPLLKKEDGRIDWTLPAAKIADRVRGFSPWPGAFTLLDGKLVKVLEARAAEGTAEPGAVLHGDTGALLAGTGKGLLLITTLQPEGKKPMPSAEFLRGHTISGKKFSGPVPPPRHQDTK
ncbi:MAG: methionyl-tRNA formyltransferase [Nitrospiraceae bacterium]|nr:methionyl-tRNA formyltransferase [Nitrospiraceae bacterium]